MSGFEGIGVGGIGSQGNRPQWTLVAAFTIFILPFLIKTHSDIHHAVPCGSREADLLPSSRDRVYR